jgi:hypothetical protein
MNQLKLQILTQLLPLCPFVRVHPSTHGCDLPPQHRAAETVTYRLGRDPSVLGVPDLELNAFGWSGTLSFHGALYFCRVPWAACDLFFVGEPFSGPVVQWPHRVEAVPQEVPVPPPGYVPSADLGSSSPKPVYRGHLRIVK